MIETEEEPGSLCSFHLVSGITLTATGRMLTAS